MDHVRDDSIIQRFLSTRVSDVIVTALYEAFRNVCVGTSLRESRSSALLFLCLDVCMVSSGLDQNQISENVHNDPKLQIHCMPL